MVFVGSAIQLEMVDSSEDKRHWMRDFMDNIKIVVTIHGYL